MGTLTYLAAPRRTALVRFLLGQDPRELKVTINSASFYFLLQNKTDLTFRVTCYEIRNWKKVGWLEGGRRGEEVMSWTVGNRWSLPVCQQLTSKVTRHWLVVIYREIG
jgi:hypothetical protein